jgi:hypothetical protein
MLRNLTLGLIVLLAGCGYATVIWRTQTGGVIELQGDHNKAMDQATGEMAEHCGTANYTVIGEGLEPVGSNRYSTQSSAGGTTSRYEQQRPAMAWHVHYQCNTPYGPAPMPAAAPLPEPPPPPPPPPAPTY